MSGKHVEANQPDKFEFNNESLKKIETILKNIQPREKKVQ